MSFPLSSVSLWKISSLTVEETREPAQSCCSASRGGGLGGAGGAGVDGTSGEASQLGENEGTVQHFNYTNSSVNSPLQIVEHALWISIFKPIHHSFELLDFLRGCCCCIHNSNFATQLVCLASTAKAHLNAFLSTALAQATSAHVSGR